MRNTSILNQEKIETVKSVKLNFFKKTWLAFVVIIVFCFDFISSGNYGLDNIEFESPEIREFCQKAWIIIKTIFISLFFIWLFSFFVFKINN